jgi:hypothetical protein
MNIAGIGIADSQNRPRGLHRPGSTRPTTPLEESASGPDGEELQLSEELKQERARAGQTQGVKPVEGVDEGSQSQGVDKVRPTTPPTQKIEQQSKVKGVYEREQRENFNRTGSNSGPSQNKTVGSNSKVTNLDATSASASSSTYGAGMTLKRIRKVDQTWGQQNTANLNQDRPGRPMTREAYISTLQKTWSLEGATSA